MDNLTPSCASDSLATYGIVGFNVSLDTFINYRSFRRRDYLRPTYMWRYCYDWFNEYIGSCYERTCWKTTDKRLKTCLSLRWLAGTRASTVLHSPTVCIMYNTGPHTARSTWLIVLRQPRTSPVDSDYALPVITNFLCCVTNSAHLVVGPSLSLDQWLGIRCQLTSVIQHCDVYVGGKVRVSEFMIF